MHSKEDKDIMFLEKSRTEEEYDSFLKPRKWSTGDQQNAWTSPVAHFEQGSIAESLFLSDACVGWSCRETVMSTWDSWPETHLRRFFLQAAAEQVLEASLGVWCFSSQYNLSILESEAGLLLEVVPNWERLTAEKNGLGRVTEFLVIDT